MQALTISRTSTSTIRRGRTDARASALAGGAGLAAAVLFLLALLPGMAAHSSASIAEPRALAAPAPLVVDR